MTLQGIFDKFPKAAADCENFLSGFIGEGLPRLKKHPSMIQVYTEHKNIYPVYLPTVKGNGLNWSGYLINGSGQMKGKKDWKEEDRNKVFLTLMFFAFKYIDEALEKDSTISSTSKNKNNEDVNEGFEDLL